MDERTLRLPPCKGDYIVRLVETSSSHFVFSEILYPSILLYSFANPFPLLFPLSQPHFAEQSRIPHHCDNLHLPLLLLISPVHFLSIIPFLNRVEFCMILIISTFPFFLLYFSFPLPPPHRYSLLFSPVTELSFAW